MLYFAIELDEERMEEDGIINVEAAYRFIDEVYAEKQVTLDRIENGVRYYTRNIDKHDFEYLWMGYSVFDERDWFKYYAKTWQFVDVDDETNKIYEDEDLLEELVRPQRPYGVESKLLLAIEMDDAGREEAETIAKANRARPIHRPTVTNRRMVRNIAGRKKVKTLYDAFDKKLEEKGVILHKIENGVSYYISKEYGDGFLNLWRVNDMLKRDSTLREHVKGWKFVIETREGESLEIDGAMADKWVIGDEEMRNGETSENSEQCENYGNGEYRLYIAVELNEQEMAEDREIRPEAAYRTIEKNFKTRDIVLDRTEDDKYFYTRRTDANDFLYLWIGNARLKRADWFQYYVKEWKFIIADESGKVRKELDLTEDWVVRPEAPQ